MRSSAGHRGWHRSGLALRYVILIVACALAACARDVVMVDPRTGATTNCRASPLNPWSQQDGCIGDHIAQGWKRSEAR